MLIYAQPLFAPVVLLLSAAYAFRHPGCRDGNAPRVAENATLAVLGIALLSFGLLITKGAGTSPLMGANELGLAIRVDAVTIIMQLLIAFIGWIVVRFSRNYLDGDARQGRFTGWLLTTLAAVLLLVTAGNIVQLVLAWVASGFCLQRLLLHYPERVAAQRAARKLLLTSLVSDVTIVAAAALLVIRYDTGDIATILELAGSSTAGKTELVIGILLALAALLKSAQFPFHGWLSEVMETPTPVSALLHAGIINAGGFLLIRLADVMLLSPLVLATLVAAGGLTALFGCVVMLTQSSVKSSLAFSTVAQMGFMIMQCGLALFPLAILHIVAHSLYKAHAFLNSSSAIDEVAKLAQPGPVAVPNVAAVARAFLIAIAIFMVVTALIGYTGQSAQSIALGAVLVFGVAYLLAQGFADEAPLSLTLRTALYSVLAMLSYFVLHGSSVWIMAGTLPPTPSAGPLEWALIMLLIISFGAVAFAQSLFPHWSHHPAASGLRVHVCNGLYVNALFDRLIGAWRQPASNSNSNSRNSA